MHGCPDSYDVDDGLADAMNYVTVVPHPCTQGLSLQVCLMSNVLCTWHVLRFPSLQALSLAEEVPSPLSICI